MRSASSGDPRAAVGGKGPERPRNVYALIESERDDPAVLDDESARIHELANELLDVHRLSEHAVGEEIQELPRHFVDADTRRGEALDVRRRHFAELELRVDRERKIWRARVVPHAQHDR